VGVVGFVCTRWGCNRMGLGAAVTAAAANEAFARGAASVVIHSSPIAVPVYRRIGFEPVAAYAVWAEGETA